LNEEPAGPRKLTPNKKELAAIILPEVHEFIFTNSTGGKNIFLKMTAHYGGDFEGEVTLDLNAYGRTIFTFDLPEFAAKSLISHQRKAAREMKNFIPGKDIDKTHIAKTKKDIV